MKGLLYKDAAILLKSYKRNVLYIMLLYAILVLMSREPYLAYAMTFIWGLYVPSTISFDEQAHWDTFASTLPVSPKQIVGAKYILGLVCTLLGGVCTLLILALLPLTSVIWRAEPLPALAECFAGILASAMVSLLVAALTLPISYKFGSARARSYVGIACIALFGVILLAFQFAGDKQRAAVGVNLHAISDQEISLGLLLGFAAILLLYAVSYAICVCIYAKKEK